jgi:hypothetical protein
MVRYGNGLLTVTHFVEKNNHVDNTDTTGADFLPYLYNNTDHQGKSMLEKTLKTFNMDKIQDFWFINDKDRNIMMIYIYDLS